METLEKFKKRNLYLVTLSIGKHYTEKFANKLIYDVLNNSDLKIYITTDVPEIVEEKFGNNERIVLNKINTDDIAVRLWLNENKVSSDFNFNLKYLCFDKIYEDQNSVVIFTDCDNSFEWWDKDQMFEYLYEEYIKGFDFFASRTDWTFGSFLKEYNNQTNRQHSIFWHKIYNYNLDKNPKPEWDDASLVAEDVLVFINNDDKLKKFYEQWKYLHDYLVKKDYTEGTWAEGFEIGVSAISAGFKAKDIGWSHHIFRKMLLYNGYKTGYKSEK
jgi:hypothetical protein